MQLTPLPKAVKIPSPGQPTTTAQLRLVGPNPMLPLPSVISSSHFGGAEKLTCRSGGTSTDLSYQRHKPYIGADCLNVFFRVDMDKYKRVGGSSLYNRVKSSHVVLINNLIQLSSFVLARSSWQSSWFDSTEQLIINTHSKKVHKSTQGLWIYPRKFSAPCYVQGLTESLQYLCFNLLSNVLPKVPHVSLTVSFVYITTYEHCITRRDIQHI